MKSRNLLFAYD